MSVLEKIAKKGDKVTANDVWDMVKAAEDARFNKEKQWYINDRFYNNEHYIYYDRITGKMKTVKAGDSQVLRQIPKTTRQLDAMINIVSSNEFRWQLKPPGHVSSEQHKEYISKHSRFLDDAYETLQVPDIMTEAILLGYEYPISYLWPGWDPLTQEFFIDVYDVFDIYFDKPNITDIEQANVMIKTFTKSLEELEEDPKYDISGRNLPQADGKVSVSDVKDAREKEKYNGVEEIGSTNVNCAEVWRKTYDKVEGQWKPVMEVYAVAGNKVIRKPQKYPGTKFPIVAYKPRPGEIYGPAWIELFLSMNKSLDSIVSSIETYAQQLAKPRLLVQGDQKVKVTDIGSAQLVEYFGGMPPQWLKPANMQKELVTLIGMLEKWIEEAGVSGVSMAQIPTQIKAGKAIEAIRQADYGNLQTAVRAGKKVTRELAQRVLEIGSRFMDYEYEINGGENEKSFTAVSQKYRSAQNIAGERIPETQFVLDPRMKVSVAVEPGLGYTEEAKRENLVMLYDKKILPGSEVLKGYQFSNISELIDQQKLEEGISMVDTEDFNMLPPEIQKAALMYLKKVSPAGQAGSPEGALE